MAAIGALHSQFTVTYDRMSETLGNICLRPDDDAATHDQHSVVPVEDLAYCSEVPARQPDSAHVDDFGLVNVAPKTVVSFPGMTPARRNIVAEGFDRQEQLFSDRRRGLLISFIFPRWSCGCRHLVSCPRSDSAASNCYGRFDYHMNTVAWVAWVFIKNRTGQG